MKVIAKPGERCPMEGRPRQYITDAAPVEVPATSYYRRLLREGSLLLGTDLKSVPKTKTKGGE